MERAVQALRVTLEQPARFALGLRIPGWVEGRPLPSDLYTYEDSTPGKWSLRLNGAELAVAPRQGFAMLPREWRTGDVVELELPMPVRRVAGHPEVAATRGMVALERGPVVYAFEGLDNDGSVMPRNATDGFAPNFDFWPRKGTTEWVAYEFAQPTLVTGVTVSWFDDTGSGECRLPAAWRVLHRTEAGAWEPVTGVRDYPVRRRDPVRVTFDPVRTPALRLEIQLRPDFSAGLYEWEVEP